MLPLSLWPLQHSTSSSSFPSLMLSATQSHQHCTAPLPPIVHPGLDHNLTIKSITRPGIVWTSPTTDSSHLSIARGHCLIAVSGSPITMKIALIKVASFIITCHLECPRRSASSTYICAGRFFSVPSTATMHVLISQTTAGVIGVLGLSSAQPIMSKYFSCLLTRLGCLAYTSDSVAIACQKGSQLDADVVDPKTMAVAKLSHPPARAMIVVVIIIVNNGGSVGANNQHPPPLACWGLSRNKILFQVEWKQNFISSKVETEFCFEWSGSGIPFWCLRNGKSWCLGNGKFWCLGNGIVLVSWKQNSVSV